MVTALCLSGISTSAASKKETNMVFPISTAPTPKATPRSSTPAGKAPKERQIKIMKRKKNVTGFGAASAPCFLSRRVPMSTSVLKSLR